MQMAGASTLDSWRERVGERTYAKDERSDVWMRYIHRDGTHAGGEHVQDTVGSQVVDPRFEHRQELVQIGVDAWRKDLSTHTPHVVGLFLAAGRTTADVAHQAVAVVDQVEAAGSITVDSKILGAYWSGMNASGGYLDVVAQYVDHDLRLKSPDQLHDTKGSGWGASVEMGRTFDTGSAWSWTPQAQVTWQQVTMDDVIVGDGRHTFGTYRYDSNDSLVGRLGLAARYQSSPRFAGWIRADVSHEFEGENTVAYVPQIRGSQVPTLTSTLAGTRYGLTAGADLRLGERASLFGSAGYEQASGNSDDNSWNARVGFRADW